MTRPQPCFGFLLWFEVPADDQFESSAIVVCSDCGALFVSGGVLDERHFDAQVYRVE